MMINARKANFPLPALSEMVAASSSYAHDKAWYDTAMIAPKNSSIYAERADAKKYMAQSGTLLNSLIKKQRDHDAALAKELVQAKQIDVDVQMAVLYRVQGAEAAQNIPIYESRLAEAKANICVTGTIPVQL